MSDVSVKVGVDSSGLSAGLAAAKNAVEGFKNETNKGISEVGGMLTKAFAVGAIIEGVKSLFDEMGRLQDLSDRFGTSAESLQRIGQAANLSGADLETVAKAMLKVNGNALDAIGGSEGLQDAFGALGIDAQAFVDLPMEDKLLALADGYEAGQGQAEKMDAVMKVLGKSGADLIPLLAGGSDALRETFKSATVASDETVAKMDEVGDKIGHVFDTLKSYGANALGFLIDRVEALGVAAAAVAAYVGNIGSGFAAAQEAADAVIDAAAQDAAEKAQEAEEKRKKTVQQQSGTGERVEAAKEAAKAAQDAEKEMARLQDENSKKRNEYHLSHITNAERELEIKKRIAELETQAASAKDKPTQLKIENEKFDLIKEQEKLQAEQKKEADKASDQHLKDAKKAAVDKAKAETDAKKEALKEAESNLSVLERGRGFSVDSLRSIGGGLSGVNYNLSASKDDLQRQQVDYAKQTVEQLKQAVKALETKQRALSGDGSFSL